MSFEEDYFMGKGSSYKGGYRFDEEAKIYFSIFLDGLKRQKNRGSVFEVGAAYGYFSKMSEKEGYDVVALDISQHACKLAKNNGIVIIRADAENLPIRHETFDTVASLNLVEHLHNPLIFLKEAYRILKPHGLIYIVTPNLRGIGKIVHRKNWPEFKDETHVNLFTPRRIRENLSEAGFGRISIKSYGFPILNTIGRYKRRMISPPFTLGDSLVAYGTKLWMKD